MQKLATIQKITHIDRVSGADFIEVVSVLGWKVVTRKNVFSVGDLCLFCEIDSLLPLNDERFKFLKKDESDKSDYFKVNTIKLKKQISQGIVFPLNLFPEIENPEEGMNVTSLLNIKKYEKYIPESLQGIIKGKFPSFLEKTDEENIQNCKEILNNKEDVWYITEKIDGSSVTFYHLNGNVGVCSRNVEKKLNCDTDIFVRAFKKLNLEEKLKNYKKNIALQGEIISSKIQGNRYKLLSGNFKVYFFTVYDIVNQQKLNYEEMVQVLKDLQLEMVPLITSSLTLSSNIENLVILAEGGSKIADIAREGIVCRKVYDSNFSFKVLNPKFLVKYGE